MSLSSCGLNFFFLLELLRPREGAPHEKGVGQGSCTIAALFVVTICSFRVLNLGERGRREGERQRVPTVLAKLKVTSSPL